MAMEIPQGVYPMTHQQQDGHIPVTVSQHGLCLTQPPLQDTRYSHHDLRLTHHNGHLSQDQHQDGRQPDQHLSPNGRTIGTIACQTPHNVYLSEQDRSFSLYDTRSPPYDGRSSQHDRQTPLQNSLSPVQDSLSSYPGHQVQQMSHQTIQGQARNEVKMECSNFSESNRGDQSASNSEPEDEIVKELRLLKEEHAKLQTSLTDLENKHQALLMASTSTSRNKSRTLNLEEGEDKFSTKLQIVVADLFNKQLYSDILIIMEDGHQIYGHKLILSARSYHWGLDNLHNIDRLDLTGMRHEVAFEVIKWVYTDDVETKVDDSFLIEMLQAAFKFQLDSLHTRCQKALIDHININNCESLSEVSDQFFCPILKQECVEFLEKHQIAPISPEPEAEDDDFDLPLECHQCLLCEENFQTLDELTTHTKTNHIKKEAKKETRKKRHKLGKRGFRKKNLSLTVDKLKKDNQKPRESKLNVAGSSKLTNKLQRMQMKARVLAGEKPYQCDQCGRAFAAKGNLKRHIGMHSDDKPYVCEICGKRFKTKSEVKRHDIVHSGEKRFMCDICSMCFSAGSSLQRHLRIHKGEKPYQCEACGKAFRSSGDVTKHNLVHTGEKPYKCPVCGKAFSRTQHVKKHLGIHRRHLQYPS